MRPILSSEQMRAFEASLMARGVPGLVLMENAGRGAAHLIGLAARPARGRRKPWGPVSGSCVRCADEGALWGSSRLILAGPGNNGGDGLVVARHLMARGARVEVLSWSPEVERKGDALLALQSFRALDGREARLESESLRVALGWADLVVDALLGTGLTRELSGELLACVELLNASKKAVYALDVPSGLDADTGRVWGAAVRATHTVTFGHLKSGLLTTAGHAHAGRITLSHIGVPAKLPAEFEPRGWLLEESDLVARLAPRPATSHKSSAGRVVVVAGSPGTTGAARLVGRAALRGGAGLCTLVSSAAAVAELEGEVLELMTSTFETTVAERTERLFAQAGSLVVGPGLGQTETAKQLIALALGAGRPTVLDADGLRGLEGGLSGLRGHPALILTPHPGEAAELLGCSTAAIESDRFGAVERLSRESGAVVVLKGSRTLVAAVGRPPHVSAWGSPALATAGSGDVLAGLLGALLAAPGAVDRGPFEAAVLGVGLHALAGELWSERNGDAGLLASEIADEFMEVRRRLLGQAGAPNGR